MPVQADRRPLLMYRLRESLCLALPATRLAVQPRPGLLPLRT